MNILASLKRLSVKDLYLHEKHEPERLEKTYRSIQTDGMIRHPILATPMDEGYLVLDGAHRLQALRKLTCIYAPVQVLNPSEFSLSSWIHQIPEGEWLDFWLEHSDVYVKPLEESAFHEKKIIAKMIRKGKAYIILIKDEKAADHLDYLRIWHQLVAAYNRQFQVCRLPHQPPQFEPGFIYFQHPIWQIDKVMEIVNQGQVLPAGVTRFLIEGRLLNLCVPLELLNDHDVALTRWNQSIKQWGENLRTYTGKIYLCER